MSHKLMTIAHIYDHNPMNCEPDNLKALCQKCHNNHDKEHRAKNRRKTISNKRIEKIRATGQLNLFD